MVSVRPSARRRVNAGRLVAVLPHVRFIGDRPRCVAIDGFEDERGDRSSCVPSPNIPVREPAPHRHAAHSWPATRAASRAPAMRPLRETVVAISPDNCMIHPHCAMRLSHPAQPFAPFEQQRAEPSGSALHPTIPDHRGGVAHLVFATAETSDRLRPTARRRDATNTSRRRTRCTHEPSTRCA